MDKNIKTGKDAREKIITGVNKLADTVKVTMGGQGKLVIIEDINKIQPIVTKDGVTVASHVDLQDPFEMQGVMLMKQVAKKTVDEVGDGTTTSVVLAQSLINEGIKSGKSYRTLQKEYDEGLKYVSQKLKKLSKKGSSLDVAKISANGDVGVAKLVNQAYKKAQLVLSEESSSKESSLIFQDGCQLENGAVHEAFSKGELGESLVVIYNDTLKNLDVLKPILEYAANENKGVLLAIENFEDIALNMLVYNHLNNYIKLAVVRIPFEKEDWFEDMEKATGAMPITEFTSDVFSAVGEVSKVVDSKSFVVTEEQAPILKEHLKTISSKRAGNFGAGICTIKVGGVSQAEKVEKLDRVDDAIGAVKSSLKLGVVPGGGNALSSFREDANLSEEFRKSLDYPRQVILENAEIEIPKEVIWNKGYDVVSGELKEDLIKAGIVDSTEGLLKALESAISVAKIVLQTNGLILTIN